MTTGRQPSALDGSVMFSANEGSPSFGIDGLGRLLDEAGRVADTYMFLALLQAWAELATPTGLHPEAMRKTDYPAVIFGTPAFPDLLVIAANGDVHLRRGLVARGLTDLHRRIARWLSACNMTTQDGRNMADEGYTASKSANDPSLDTPMADLTVTYGRHFAAAGGCSDGQWRGGDVKFYAT